MPIRRSLEAGKLGCLCLRLGGDCLLNSKRIGSFSRFRKKLLRRKLALLRKLLRMYLLPVMALFSRLRVFRSAKVWTLDKFNSYLPSRMYKEYLTPKRKIKLL